MSSSGDAAAIFTRGSTEARSRVTNETSASGSAPGVSSAATALPRPLSISSRAGLNFGTLADSSEVGQRQVRGDAHVRPLPHISRSPARLVVEMRIDWRAALISPEAGSLSLLRVALATRSSPVTCRGVLRPARAARRNSPRRRARYRPRRPSARRRTARSGSCRKTTGPRRGGDRRARTSRHRPAMADRCRDRSAVRLAANDLDRAVLP